jgi:cobalt-zinc-cadmium efflux system outer membrane protein
MNSLSCSWRPYVFACVALAWAAPTVAAPLSLADALDKALRQAPSLAAVSGRIDAARHAALGARELPDPKLSVGVENVPVSGMDRFSLTGDFMTMQRIGVMQDVPNRDKRDARMAIGQARIARAESERRVAFALVRRETAVAWIRRASLEEQLARLDVLDAENRLLDATVRAQLAAGRGMPTDVVMPRQEAAMLAERRDELVAQRVAMIAALRRWVGEAALEPLTGAVPAWSVDRASLEARLHRHPELGAFDAMAGMLDAELREAESMKKVDWGVQLAYQRRGPAYDDMISVMVNIDLPIFPARRQDPQIAAKAAERGALEAERAASWREHRQQLDADLAELDRLDRSVERYRSRFLALAQERVDLAVAGYRSGRGALADVVAARRELADLALKAVSLKGERDALAARLHFTYDDASEGVRP